MSFIEQSDLDSRLTSVDLWPENHPDRGCYLTTDLGDIDEPPDVGNHVILIPGDYMDTLMDAGILASSFGTDALIVDESSVHMTCKASNGRTGTWRIYMAYPAAELQLSGRFYIGVATGCDND